MSSQCVSIRRTAHLAAAGIELSVGSIGDTHDNAVAETNNRRHKAEVIYRCSPWKTLETVELATSEWIAWFKPSPPARARQHCATARAETAYHRQFAEPAMTR